MTDFKGHHLRLGHVYEHWIHAEVRAVKVRMSFRGLDTDDELPRMRRLVARLCRCEFSWRRRYVFVVVGVLSHPILQTPRDPSDIGLLAEPDADSRGDGHQQRKPEPAAPSLPGEGNLDRRLIGVARGGRK